MKYYALIFILFFAFAGNAQIRRTTTPRVVTVDTTGKSDSKKDALKSIGLTKEQKSKLKELREAMKSRKSVVKNDSTLSPQTRKMQLKELNEEQKKQIMLLLTDEQKQQLILLDPEYGDMVPMPKRGNSGASNQKN